MMPLPDTFQYVSEEENNYHESSDEDFNPATLAAEASSSSEDDDRAEPSGLDTAPRKRKRKVLSPIELDSGDERTIEAAKKRKARKKDGGDDGDTGLLFSDDEGGEGGLIKTRAQRRVEQKERKPLAHTEGATVDVDALWQQMLAVPLQPVQSVVPSEAPETLARVQDGLPPAHDYHPPSDNEDDLVTVQRIYTFAGQRTTEEKRIARSALERYVSDGWRFVTKEDEPAVDDSSSTSHSRLRRPLRRPSRFDPNPAGQVRGLAPEFQATWTRKVTVTNGVEQENSGVPTPSTATGPGLGRPVETTMRLNVVDKSRLDWTGYVDKEGIAEELDEHGKAKEAYLGRMDFLADVEARREEERRRLKGLAAGP